MAEQYYIEDVNDTKKYLKMLQKGGLSEFPPLIVSCAITGGNQGKESNPNLPEAPDEQVQQTLDAYNAGAALVHVHGRGPDPESMGDNTSDTNVFRELNYRIREKCPDLIINNTAICGRWWSEEGGLGGLLNVSLEALPEAASIDITNYSVWLAKKKRPAPLTGRDEDIFGELSYAISHRDVEYSIEQMKSRCIKPEFEMFSLQDVHFLNSLVKKGLVEPPYWVQMIFSPIFNHPLPEVLRATMNLLPEKSILSCITTGAAQFPFITLAMIMGCHVRVGMEDNFYIARGELAQSNAQLVEKIVRIAKELGRPIATPAQAREMLGLGAPRKYAKP
jgi:3-keto-5-aminohexanoate cleavage enzyme